MNEYRLVVCEKPSVARSIAAVLGAGRREDGFLSGGGYLVSWCFGHLAELSDADAYDEKYGKWRREDLPILPESWQYTVARDKQKQMNTLRALMHRDDVYEVVNACDAGREGELIFRTAYTLNNCRKRVKRLWISSMEDAAILQGFDNLRDGAEYDNLYASALCRSKADWLVGINATRLFSVLYHRTLNVGRVLSPTLALIVQREAEIGAFRPEAFYTVNLRCGDFAAVSEKFKEKAEADALAAACAGQPVTVKAVQRTEKTEKAPLLYDLTALQREANRSLGYTAQQTLDYLQALYEKKLLTYPRTDSAFLTDDMGETATGIIKVLCEKLSFMEGADFSPEIAKVLNSKKVSDHHAIIPTMELAKADPDALPESEKNILTLAGARLLFATAEPHIYEAVTAVFSCAGTDFTARGKTVLAEGWKELQRRYRATLKDKPEAEDGENADVTLPKLSEGQGFPNPAAKVTEHTTTPPKPHSEASLLSAMERAGNGDTDPDAERRGLGTPATRAAVIEKLVKGGFAEHKGKQLIPTQNGAALISILPDMLTSPQLTAEWENNLTQIAKGAADPGEFLSGIEAMARELVQTHAAALDGKKDLFREEKPSVGKCPRCGSPVHEGKKNYYCSNKECAFVMWKNDRFFEERKTAFSAKIAAALLKSGKANVKKLYSPKTGKTYDGTIVLADTGGKYVNYRIEVQKN